LSALQMTFGIDKITCAMYDFHSRASENSPR
jgi:hypothetical protein